MKRTRRIEITVETDRVFEIRRRAASIGIRCRECIEDAGMVTPEAAANLAHVSPRTIYQWVESGKVHFTETTDGFPMICINSCLNEGFHRRMKVC